MKRNKPRIGIFGGTFNPVHIAHVSVATEFIKSFDLDLLYVIPNRIAPLKNPARVSPEHRVNMLKIAFSGNERVEISEIELKREGASYTCDTVRELKERHPDSELFLLTGDDWVGDFDKWKNYKYILDSATLVIAYREGGDITAHLDRLERLSGHRPLLLENKRTEISSTELRERLDADYLPSGVLEYIKKQGLYND